MMDTPHEETLFEFPCEFPVKVMGRDFEQMHAVLLEVITRYAKPEFMDSLKKQDSSSGKYTSLTVTVTADSKEQLDNIYRELTASEHILVAL